MIELLVVMLIITLLLSISLKGMMGKKSQRELTSSVDLLASDMRWARSEAAKNGAMVYVAFEYKFDANQIEPPFGLPVGTEVWDSGKALPPDNPGVSRACKGYLIVEARPRFHAGPPPAGIRSSAANSRNYIFSEWGTTDVDGLQYAKPAGVPYTYRDYLGDLWMANNYAGSYHAPLEPVYPRDDAATNALLAANSVARDDYNVNRDSVPAIFYPFLLYGDSGTNTTYQVASGYLGDDYNTAIAANDLAWFRQGQNQACKVFDTANRDEIIEYNAGYGAETKTLPSGTVVENQTYDPGTDHPRMEDQIVDYVTILKRDLPDHVFLVNPHKAKFLVYHRGNPAVDGVYEDFQYFQFLLAIDPQGRTSLREWSFDPEYFPPSSPQNNSDLVHGTTVLRSGIPQVRSMFMVTDDALSFSGASALVSSAAASDSDGNGRTYTYWPLSGKYYVDAYPPNDKQFFIPDNDPRLNVNDAASGLGKYISSYGYQRNFLVP